MSQTEQHLEIEAKLLVDDLVGVKARLEALGAALSHARVFERNVRYEDPAGTLTPHGIVLRLRQDDHARLTYKGPPDEAARVPGLQARFEAEVTVSDFDTMDVILRKLGFHPFMVYEKYRTTYVYNGAEIMLDEMPYGSFVEIEGHPDRIEPLIEALGLADARRFEESYARLFDYVRANLGLAFNDLTFANFAGINVPPGAFEPPESRKR